MINLITALLVLQLLLLPTVLFVGKRWLGTKIDASVKAGYDRALEEYRYDTRVKEQASIVADYLAAVWRHELTSSVERCEKGNALGWKLALYLPDEIYRHVVKAVENPDEYQNIATALIAIRHLLLKSPGTLTAGDIAWHHPDAKSFQK